MSAIKPTSRPRQPREVTLLEVRDAGYSPREGEVFVVGIRGYYRDTMGVVGQNDRGMYDDAAFILGPHGLYHAYNFNTDPSKYRAATTKLHGMACLAAGHYMYKPGQHGLSRAGEPGYPYPAFVQAGSVAVHRDGQKGLDVGYFGINIHRGGDGTTSSLGCQTVPPEQWAEFRDTLKAQLRDARQGQFAYILIERKNK